jgi:phosphatidate cytidylyltransferase
MLWTRVLSALVLAPIAIGAVYVGGWLFALFWAIAAAVALWEWITLVGGLKRYGWAAAGLVYAVLLLLAPVVLRSDPTLGMTAIFFLFAAVWTTDIAGYFAGRAIGGPKLMPSVSPKKTWSGAVAGLVGSMVVVWIAARFFQQGDVMALLVIALVLSVASQAGDLAESAFKRRFGAKDSGRIIPGHGGVMDRLDGFWAAALCGAIIGVARGGFAEPARGLLLW